MTMIYVVNKSNTFPISGTFRTETGVAIPLATLTTVTLTLVDRNTGTVINSRDAQNVKNANGCTIDAAGNLTLTLTPSDNPVLGTLNDGAEEVHIGTLQWTWSAGAKERTQEFEVRVIENAAVDNVGVT